MIINLKVEGDDMDKLSIAIQLLQEAQEKEKILLEYKKDEAALDVNSNFNHTKTYDEVYGDFNRKWKTVPKKSVILDNVKMARRLLNEYRKEWG